jgi:hypothetical protein
MTAAGYAHGDAISSSGLGVALGLMALLGLIALDDYGLSQCRTSTRQRVLLPAAVGRAPPRPVPVLWLPGMPIAARAGAAELAAIRRQEELLRGPYGCADRRRGALRIPLPASIDQLSERGLPGAGSPP